MSRVTGAIIIRGIECDQMTVGSRLHTAGMGRGDDHDENCLAHERGGLVLLEVFSWAHLIRILDSPTFSAYPSLIRIGPT